MFPCWHSPCSLSWLERFADERCPEIRRIPILVPRSKQPARKRACPFGALERRDRRRFVHADNRRYRLRQNHAAAQLQARACASRQPPRLHHIVRNRCRNAKCRRISPRRGLRNAESRKPSGVLGTLARIGLRAGKPGYPATSHAPPRSRIGAFLRHEQLAAPEREQPFRRPNPAAGVGQRNGLRPAHPAAR